MITHQPPERRVTGHVPRVTPRPSLTYTPLHHTLLDAVWLGVVTVHPDHYHLVCGVRVHGDVESGFGWLLMADHAEIGPEPDGEGRLPVLLTPLGVGVLQRWNAEQGRVERSGGAE